MKKKSRKSEEEEVGSTMGEMTDRRISMEEEKPYPEI